MKLSLVRDLADISEFRQTLLARPPRFVHATVGLLVTLIAAAVVWAALTEVSVVIRAGGRVRPAATATTVIYGGSGEGLNGGVGGRVVEVNVDVGKAVKAGDVLVRFDTERVDNEIAKRKKIIAAAEDELATLTRNRLAIDRQNATARAKAVADLEAGLNKVRAAKEKQAGEVEVATRSLEDARLAESGLRRTALSGASSPMELRTAESRTKRAEMILKQARQPVDEGEVKVLSELVNLAAREADLRTAEYTAKVEAKKVEAAAARLDLPNLELERRAAVVRAPASGVVVSDVSLAVGTLLERGKVIAEIAPTTGLVVEAAVPSDETGELVAGMEVKVKLDAFDYQKYGTLAGRLESVSPDSAVADGRVVYRLRVAVDDPAFGRGANRAEARLGMAAQVEVVVNRRSLLMVFIKKVRQSISFA